MTEAIAPLDTLFDSRERHAALDVTQSFIVQAPAGSGKTELLIQRILSLLCHVRKPEEILAITFTRKAANEMRLRVINALKLAKKAKPTTSHAEKTWILANKVLERDSKYQWGIVQNPNQLNIQTIDSLCSYLTTQLPLLSEFGSPPNIVNQADVLYEKAIDAMLADFQGEMAYAREIQSLLLHLDNNIPKFKSLLINLLSKRDQWIPYLHYASNSDTAKQQLEKYIQLVINEKLVNLKSIFPVLELNELSAILFECANNLKENGQLNPLNAFFINNQPPSPHLSDLNKWIALASFLLTKSGDFRKRTTIDNGFFPATHFKNKEEKSAHEILKKRYTAIILSFSDNELLKKSLHDLLFLPQTTYCDAQWKILYSLLQILKISLAQLRVVFKEYGQIDFIENTQAALLALGDDEHPTNLTLALDYQFKHILIDEFQDTSITQFSLLEKLVTGWEANDGRSLFVVGDPMQSIYRFRDAEVGLFIKIWNNGIKNIPLKKLKLSLNFRSSSKIVEWNNQHFSSVFPSVNLISEGAVTFSQSMTPIQDDMSHSFVEILASDDNDPNAEAIVLANKIAELHHKYPHETIAILVRSRSHIKTIIPVLKKQQLTFQASEIDNLYAKQSIKDLIALTSALFDLSNKVAWLAVLRAPWCGLSLNDLLIISSNDQTAILWYRLIDSAVIDQLSEKGKCLLQRLLSVFKTKLSERDRVPLVFLVESAWMLLGGPACLDNETSKDDIDFFFSLLESVQYEFSASTKGQFEALIKKAFSSSNESKSPLLIMTIHAAKGLEFDTVIVPHLEKSSPPKDKELLAWLEYPLSNQSMSLLLAPLQAMTDKNDLLHHFIHTQQKIKFDYEVSRLLYVATTRAKKRLLLSFSMNYGDVDAACRPGSFLQKLWPHIQHEFHKVNDARPLKENDTIVYQQKRLRRLHANWINPLLLDRQKNTIHQKKLGFSLQNETPRLMGNIIHDILHVIAKKQLSWWLNLDDSHKENIVSSYMRFMHMPLKTQLITRQKIITALNNITKDPVGIWILQPHALSQSEYAISIDDENNSNYVIDRTFVDEHDVRWIIDYKTMDTMEADLDQHIEVYQNQLIAYANAFRLIEQRCIKLGLYFTALPAWREVLVNLA